MPEPGSELRVNVHAWARDALRFVNLRQSQSMDLDGFVELDADKKSTLRKAVVAYSALVEFMADLDFRVQPSLHIRLKEAAHLVPEFPNSLARLVADLHEWTPPMLYLTDWRFRIRYLPLGAYRYPLQLDIPEPLPANTFTYYQTVCAVQEDPDDWQRLIEVEYYPGRYQVLPLPEA